MAALLTRMSRPPKRSMVAATQASACVGVAGVGGVARRPSPPHLGRRGLRARPACATTSITGAPDAAYAAAMARPIPCDAPVTSATFPSSRISMSAGPYRSGSGPR